MRARCMTESWSTTWTRWGVPSMPLVAHLFPIFPVHKWPLRRHLRLTLTVSLAWSLSTAPLLRAPGPRGGLGIAALRSACY